MTDSTQVTLPAAQAFISGKLEMSVNMRPGALNEALTWADYPADYISVMVAVILILVSLRMLISLYPFLLDSASRWKGCITIDSSIRLKSDRNLLGLIWLLPLVLMADRFGLFTADTLGGIEPQWHVFATAGIIAVWLLLRLLGFVLCGFKAKKPETLRTAYKCIFNYIILFVSILIVPVGIFSITGASDKLANALILYGTAAFYLLALLRETQILRTFCGQFRTFLYLCALELIPTGALIAGNILF